MADPRDPSFLGEYFRKINSAGKCTSAAPPLSEQVWIFGGAFISIGIISYLTYMQGIPILIAPFGASTVLIFGVPASPFSQPRNVLGGHMIAALVGVGLYHLFGEQWFVPAFSVAITMVLIFAARMVHPPAGATAIVASIDMHHWSFVLFPVAAGCLILILVAVLFNNLAAKRSYPAYWW